MGKGHSAIVLATLLGAGLLPATSRPAAADVILSGPDSNDGSYSTAALAGVANGSDTVSADGATGISLWGLLGGANSASPTSPTYGAITTSTPAGDNNKNAILRYYLVATGSNGTVSLVSLGEIDPNFGGTAPVPAFVAFQNSGGLLASPELIVPGGEGRDVSNLVSLQLLAAPAMPIGPGGQSNAVTLSGLVNNPATLSKTDLQALGATQETISGDTYTGVPFWTLLNPSNPDIIAQYVITAGTDGYEVVLSLAELDPALGGDPNALVPYADSAGTDFPSDGVARTILPNDNKHGRWESNLVTVDVEIVPEPSSIALLLSGIVGFGAMTRRRRASLRRS